MNQPTVLPTDFAPAERASSDQVEQQFIAVESSPAVQQVFDKIPHIAFVLNLERQIVYANHCLLDFLGVDEQDSVKGTRPGEAMHCIHSTETPGGCGTTKNCSTCGAVLAILAEQGSGRPQSRECRISRKVGDHTDSLDLRVWTDHVDIHDQRYTIMLVMDISDEKRRHVLERIFFHDIKNTAMVMQGAVEFLADTPGLSTAAPLSDQLRPIVDQLIREILAQEQLLAAERNELRPEPGDVDTRAFLEEICERYRRDIQASGICVEVVDFTGCRVKTDRTLLERVIGNMLKNALEAAAPGETVTINAIRLTDHIRFQVRNPQFIEPEIQLQIFQRSFSTKGAGRGTGTHSIKLLAERYMHGRVGFTSTGDDGTMFFVDLPA